MTVSRALRRDAAVSAPTRARVLEVVDEIGYVPDQAAGALSSGRSGLVAAIMPTLTNPLFTYVCRGLRDTLSQAGLELFLGASDYDAQREEDLLQSMLRRRPEAVAIAGVGHGGKTSRLLSGAGIPVIEFLDGADPPIDNLIGIDSVAVGREIVSYLTKKGRRRIGVVAFRDNPDRRSERRVDAMAAAARALGLPEPAILRHGAPASPVEQGARGACAALDDRDGFDALVFMNDYAAIGGVGALERAGVRVPDDIAVFGFGDCEVAAHVRPSLTTISFNPAAAGVEIGKIVLSALDAVRHGRPRQPFRLTLDFQVVERESA